MWVSRLLQKHFVAGGNDCGIIPIEDILADKITFDPDACDRVGIGYPVHAMDAPRIVMDFIKALPPGRYPYFLFKSAGSRSLGGGSSRKVRLALANKGWKLCHEEVYQMPANMMGSPSLHRVERMVEDTRQRVEASVSEILDGVRVLLPDTPVRRFASMLNIVQSYGCRQASSSWQVSEACTMCGKCARECPTGNISIQDGRLVFDGSCVLCLRCWWNCPVKALSHPRMGWSFNKKGFILPEI